MYRRRVIRKELLRTAVLTVRNAVIHEYPPGEYRDYLLELVEEWAEPSALERPRSPEKSPQRLHEHKTVLKTG
jgi:hypothetical protein